ncbi:hypothetical protein PF001_g26543 [Phytophthora fragariae]|uniref:PH domain-containing protein n=1 Tax=Phytophthora fragariae TaxID=53985 RepID=A0A6A4BSP0_9STRA|nr:hypothetical protein PF003_g20545 [Phytophthora fragariae]KAE9275518.1 hypothetical protein PF001_g26543 [Phytophthora fragariae]
MVSAPQSSVASARLPSSSSKRMEAVGQSTALLSAYLLKQSAGKWKRKRWNQRWFVLDRDNGVLRYFRHASPLEAVPLRSDAHGVLALKQAGASLVVQGDLPAGVPTPFCFTVVVDGQKEVRLCADTNAEFRQWTTAISAIISPVRAGSRTGEAKVAPARAVSPASSSSSAAELPSPLQSPVQEVKKVEVEVEEDTETVNEEVGVEPLQVMEQLHGFVGNNRVLLIALNPAIGPNYRKTKMKAASAPALLELIAVDVYQSVVKADNVGSIVDLSVLKPAAGDLDLFIVNCQVPSYQPSNPLWGEKQGDGPGFNFVTYFAIPPAIRKMLDAPGDPPLQAVRLLKGFMQPQSWVSERFKAIGIVVNPEEQKLGRAERHLLETYNGQPILTRPQHQFYRGNGYFEVDVNAHDFNYVARKGLVGVSDHACNMILDFGFVLEGQEDHELPEQILGSVRLCKVDVRQAPSLS